MNFQYSETVTLISRTISGRDADGNDTMAEVRTDIPGCVFNPGGEAGGGNENVQARDTVTLSPTVYLPAGTNVRAVDAVEVRGLTYEVDGVPADYGSPFTGTAIISIRLKAVQG